MDRRVVCGLTVAGARLVERGEASARFGVRVEVPMRVRLPGDETRGVERTSFRPRVGELTGARRVDTPVSAGVDARRLFVRGAARRVVVASGRVERSLSV